MNYRSRALLVLFILLLASGRGFAWTTVGDGIEYQSYTISGPNNLFVTRLLRSNTNVIIDCTLANGNVDSTQTVPNQYDTYNDAVYFDGNDWGPRYDMVAAVNGDLFLSGGAARGMRVSNGWYSSQINTDADMYGMFGWTSDRNVIMSGFPNAVQTMSVTFNNTTATLAIDGINRAPASTELCLFNPTVGLTTGTDNTVSEVLVQLTTPNLINQSGINGYIKGIYTNSGSTTMPFDCIVLSAKGAKATSMIANAAVGEKVTIKTTISSYLTDGTTGVGNNWRNTIAGINGARKVLENSNIIDYSSTSTLMSDRHPRTAVAYNDNYVFFVVCDGRNPGVSIGMTGVELATFCKNTLGATNALSLDGGGSSTMVVNGNVKNIPSDGSPRAVADALVMANVKAKQQSKMFTPGQFVSITGSTVNFRRGPGTINPAISVLTKDNVGTITYHRLGGIMTKGGYWWEVNFNGVEGWMSETYLAPYGTNAPTITLQPISQTVTSGDVTLVVEATGSGNLSYKWQKDGVDISDGDHYSGSSTAKLVISDVAYAAGNYRCVVTNPYGGAASDAAVVATTNPAIYITISGPSKTITSTASVYYTVTFKNATTISPSITLNKTDTANADVTQSYVSSTQRKFTLKNITGDGNLGITLAAGSAYNDSCSSPSVTSATAVTVDNTAPGSVVVTDQGKYTANLNALSATWTSASDANGVASYQYAIGTTAVNPDVVGWTNAGNVTSISNSSLSLAEGTIYYFLVRAIDNAGNTGAMSASDGILAAPGISRISDAFVLADSVPFALRDKTVIAARAGAFWIEENNRTTALQVVSSYPVALWDRISVAGCLNLFNGARAMVGNFVEKTGTSVAIAPLGMGLRSLGGSSFNSLTPGITGGKSLYNLGMLVRCWGRVTGRNSENPNDRIFYINDGSVESAVSVHCGSFDLPVSDFVGVTGVVCSEATDGVIKPYLFVRSKDDITQL